jgi:hypothetical protein
MPIRRANKNVPAQKLKKGLLKDLIAPLFQGFILAERVR